MIDTNNKKLTKNDLMPLEEYSRKRQSYRQRVMSHKKNRQIDLGPNARLYFEDRLTMQYQIQEILRIEKIFAADAIEEELEAYNPLIPDGGNWKATFMIEYPNEDERRMALSRLIGIERQIWIQIGDLEPVRPIANEDLVRETEDKTSAVHFLRFELSRDHIQAIRQNSAIVIGVSHENYRHVTDPIPENIAKSLSDDLDLLH